MGTFPIEGWKGCIIVLICVNLDLAHGYLTMGGQEKQLSLSISKNFPNTFKENISEFQSVSFRMDPETISGINVSISTMRLIMWVDEDTPSLFPVYISVIQRHEISVIQLPYTHQKITNGTSVRYTMVNRTICLLEVPRDENRNFILIRVSTGSSQAIGFQLRVLVKDHLSLGLDEVRSYSITPMSTEFLKVPYSTNMSNNLIVKISSDNNLCMAVAIQEPHCPVFHVENNFRPESNWELVSTNGMIRVNTGKYPQGFFVKLLLLHDDSLCGRFDYDSSQRRTKGVSIKLENDLPLTVTSGVFWFQISIPPVFSLIVAIVIGALYLITYACTRKRVLPCTTYDVNKSENKELSLQTFNQPPGTKGSNFGRWTIFVSILYVLPIFDQAFYNRLISKGNNGLYGICTHEVQCAHAFWIFEEFNHIWSNISYAILGLCFVLITLAKKCIRTKVHDEGGVQFFPGLFYAMGLGLVAKGFISLSYHFCPSLSNFQYDIIYLSMIIVICQLQLTEFRRPNTITIDAATGVLAGVLLISALGLGFERHFWKSEEAFFIFRIVVATIQGVFIFYAAVYAIYIGYPINRFPKPKAKEEVPLHQIRLGDLRPVFETDDTSRQRAKAKTEPDIIMQYFSDIPRCFYIFPKIWSWKLPKFRFERLLYVILLAALNGYLIYESLNLNYSVYVLLFLGTNFGLNLLYYFAMKITFGEFSLKWKSLQVYIYFLLAVGFGIISGYFFLQNLPTWSDPRVKGNLVEDSVEPGCSWLEPIPFFDNHDTWHILSAHFLFFVFMVLLSIDDGVEGVNREHLVVF